jgi:WD40 repeat protein
VESLSLLPGLSAVAIRETSAIVSPLTLGLFRPGILLPSGWRHWAAAQRDLILGHELAHVRRRDFLAGLVAELAACLCWFHPLVRWLAGRLRLEQEFAADAWVASARIDPTDYVRCLARLALEQSQGRGSLAPALWRRRPEILRRIDMLRHYPRGLSPRLGRRAAWTVAVLAGAACLAVAGVGPLHSAPEGDKGGETPPQAKVQAPADSYGDALPAGALARLGTTRLRHGADVTFVAFGPEGKTLLTAGQDNTVRLWDLADGKELRRFARPAAVPPRPAAKGDKPAADARAEVQVTLALQQLMAGGREDRSSFSVALAADGKTLAASGPNVIQLWQVADGKELARIEMPSGGLSGLLFSPDGRTLAGRAADGTLVLWSAETGKEVRRIKPAPRPRQDGVVIILGGREADPPGMAFTPDGKALAAAATDYDKQEAVHSVKLWDLASGKEIQRIKVPGGSGVSAVAVAPGGKVVASGGGGIVHLCQADTGKELHQFKTGDGGVLALAFTPDGKTLAVRSRNQRVRLWETETAKELRQLVDAETNPRAGGLANLVGFSGPETRALAIAPDGKQVAAASGSTVRLWETATGKELPLPDGHRRAPSSITLSGDGKSVISWGPDRVVRRWEAATGKSLGTFAAPPGTTAAAFTADGRTVALANADDTLRIHETAAGKELHRIKGPQGVTGLAFAPDGAVLAVRGRADNAIRLYDVARGVELRQITPRPPSAPAMPGRTIVIGGPARPPRGTGPGLAFSPDGGLLVATGASNDALSRTLTLFDVASGKELRKIESPRPIASFAFSPDGRTLAAENNDRTITLWEVASARTQGQMGEPAPEPRQRNAGMNFRVVLDGVAAGGFNERAGPVGLTFSPDGRVLAARGADRAVHFWDVDGGKEIGQLKGHEGRVETVAFAPDGKTLATGAADTTVLLWNATDPMKDLAKPEAGEIPTAEAEALWGDLAGEDAGKALRGVRRLASTPRQAVALLGVRLKPAARVEARKIDGWIADLESEKYAVRQEAASSLLKVGEQAVPPLRKVLTASPPLETRKRVEELLDRLTSGTLTAEQLRLVRAVEALERAATPEARQLLRTLAGGAPGTLTTREARAALDRLGELHP